MITRTKIGSILGALGVSLMLAASAPADARTYVRHTTIEIGRASCRERV